ncbi:coiled-coil domain-containing protein [Streptomyces liangshanensis]|uniref:cellulose-binding protein n=1 Tax=Streptomyces liangshanensis TaxID=2717324 RepID=UPI0036D9ECE9
MSAAQPSVHGFVPTRGRGYHPEQVDHQVAALSQGRDDAWERAARLTVLAKRMEGEAALLRERLEEVRARGPQTYESLGGRAPQIMTLTADEGDRVRAEAREEARAVLDTARAEGREAKEAAREASEAVRAEAEAYVRDVLGAARAVADAGRAEARGEAKGWRGEALEELREMRRRTQAVLEGLEKGHAERLAATEREIASREAGWEVRTAELSAYAQAELTEAQRAFSEAGERARHGQEDAQARAAELLAAAGASADRALRDAEGAARANEAAGEEVRAHMTSVRNALAALTGRAPAEG